MNKTPIIGISSNITFDKRDFFIGFNYVSLSSKYIESVSRAKATPLVLPAVEDIKTIENMISSVDAIIISGGYDINPMLWGEEPHKDIEAILPKRDAFEYNLIKFANTQKKPILGICRGAQLLNVVFGGTLWQDISKEPEFFINHNQKALAAVRTHSIVIEKNSCMYPILGEKSLVNSYHHMAIKEVAPNFKITAKAPDGVIEMIENSDENLKLGVQWHPEMLSKEHQCMQEIFNYFVQQCQ